MTIPFQSFPRWLLHSLLLLPLLWQFENYAVSRAPLNGNPQPTTISTWTEHWPADTPFLLVQEVRDQFRHADAKRDAGTPVRDIAAMPLRPDGAS